MSFLPKANGGNMNSSALGTDVPCLVSMFTLSSFYTEDTGSERPDDLIVRIQIEDLNPLRWVPSS